MRPRCCKQCITAVLHGAEKVSADLFVELLGLAVADKVSEVFTPLCGLSAAGGIDETVVENLASSLCCIVACGLRGSAD